MYRLIIFIITFISTTSLELHADDRIIPVDSTFSIQVERYIPSDHIADYVNRPEYSYRKSILYETNVFKRYWNAFKNWLNNALGVTADSGLDTLLFYLFIILAVLALVYHLMKSTYNNPWQKKSISDSESPEIYMNKDGSINLLKQKIADYESKGDMRQALRYRYIMAVWKLNKNGVIQWQPEMTNFQILRKISSPQIKGAFKNIVSIYEHIWYGRYPIETEKQYLTYRDTFNSFHDKVNLLS
ncbi:MAG: hypothetical protein HKN68_01170 [Saprospiraceae bacterium]|nr:hypothetical protein [Saprospiraceae bacterium]